jgi:hypothetical protein
MHTIYHIPGKKVGCTTNFKRRVEQYPEGTLIEVLEVLENVDDQAAGDCEWKWADHFGYRRYNHYCVAMNARRVATQKSAKTVNAGRNGAKALLAKGPFACDVCGQAGNPPNIFRYHFANCKKEIYDDHI